MAGDHFRGKGEAPLTSWRGTPHTERAISGPGLTAAFWILFPARVLVDQVVTVNRGRQAVCPSAGDEEHRRHFSQ